MGSQSAAWHRTLPDAPGLGPHSAPHLGHTSLVCLLHSCLGLVSSEATHTCTHTRAYTRTDPHVTCTMLAHMCTHICTHPYTDMHTHVHTCMQAYAHASNTHKHALAHARAHTHMYMHCGALAPSPVLRKAVTADAPKSRLASRLGHLSLQCLWLPPAPSGPPAAFFPLLQPCKAPVSLQHFHAVPVQRAQL